MSTKRATTCGSALFALGMPGVSTRCLPTPLFAALCAIGTACGGNPPFSWLARGRHTPLGFKNSKEEIQIEKLKRTLSLVLAAVMLVGMMVVGASAASSDFRRRQRDHLRRGRGSHDRARRVRGHRQGRLQPTGILEPVSRAAKIVAVDAFHASRMGGLVPCIPKRRFVRTWLPPPHSHFGIKKPVGEVGQDVGDDDHEHGAEEDAEQRRIVLAQDGLVGEPPHAGAS